MTDIRVAAEQATKLKAALDALEHFTNEMTVGERYTNLGQYALDALMPCRAALASLEAALAALPGDTSKEQALDLIGELEAVRTINAPEGYILASGLHTLRRYIEQSHSAATPAVESSQIAGRDGASAAPSDEGCAKVDFDGRVIEIDYERSTLLVRYEGLPPEIGAGVIPVGLPVAYQHHYPDGGWRVNHGEAVNGLRPDASRPLYAPLEERE